LPPEDVPSPLDGVHVLEVANWVAAPSAAALLADLGARVIKVEPPGGDAMRYMARQPDVTGARAAMNYAFQQDNRGKESIVLDLERDAGREVLLRLCERADVLVSNMVPRRQARFRLTPSELWERNPRLVYASLTSYGLVGPEADRGGFDNASYFARSGISLLTGGPESPVLRFRTGMGDHAAALSLIAAVLAALRLRDRTGRGQLVDASLFGTAVWTLGQNYSAALADGRQPPRFDPARPANPIANAYATRDGRWVVLTMGQSDRYWARFCDAIGRPELATDPAFETADGRRDSSERLTRLIATAFAGEDLAYWRERLNAAGLLWAPALELPEVCEDEQARAIGIFASVQHPVAGRFDTVAAPFRLAGVRVRGPAPEYGAHTWAVLGEIGLPEEEVVRLAEAGAFG
jgi:crotonobetainyl-CoA:carnitine CoA-transferase CaiB-like acyl-CoA transferase